jgi:hypothetical protein
MSKEQKKTLPKDTSLINNSIWVKKQVE